MPPCSASPESSDEESGDEDKKKEEEASVLPQGAAEEAKDSRVFEVPEMRPWDQGKNLAQMVNEPRFRKKKRKSRFVLVWSSPCHV